ncbi:MAG: AraC family transcriptional regulator [Rhizobiales bacterium]|nr:AraC family transcriptional regulator [Hyphomicrobiales bacterium]
MSAVVFTSDDLPAHLDDRARLARWNETFEELTCSADYCRADDQPFRAHFHWAPLEGLYVTQFGGTFSRIARTSSAIARRPDDDFCILLNRGTAPIGVCQRGSDLVVAPGQAHLSTNGEAAEIRAGARCDANTVTVGRDRLRALVGDAEDLLARPVDAGHPAVRHLGRYVESVVGLGDAGRDAALDRHVATTLLDLVALSLGAGRDAAALARARGLRAARLQDILSGIRSGFIEPDFSPRVLAARLGLSPRYIQDILHEAGPSFSERVLDLRLNAARRMLASAAGPRLKISEIALACGFSDVSYFNQAFRRRFGASPSQCRG